MRVEGELNLLFTGVGRRVELIRAFQRAYASLGIRGTIVAVDTDPLAPAFQAVHKSYVVPRSDAPEYVPTLLKICEEEGIDLLFPLIDPDVPVLAPHRDLFLRVGTRLVVVSPEVADLVTDKYNTGLFFARLGLPTPATWLPGEVDPESLHYPLFIKPRRGSGSRYAFRVGTSKELEFFLGYVPEPIIQEYIPGPQIATDVIVGLDGEILGAGSRRILEMRCGDVAKAVTVYVPDILEASVKIVSALQAIGPVVGPINIQCLLKGGFPYFTEINARFAGGSPLNIAAGVDSPRWLLAMAAGLSVDRPPLGSYEEGLVWVRYDESFYLRGGFHG